MIGWGNTAFGSTIKTVFVLSGKTAMPMTWKSLIVIGPAGLIRFLRQFHLGGGDYSVDRHQWLDKLTFEDIRAELEKNRKK